MTSNRPVSEMVERRCTCAEVQGENPDCILHGVSVEIWAAWTDTECDITPEIDSCIVRRKCQQHLARASSQAPSDDVVEAVNLLEGAVEYDIRCREINGIRVEAIQTATKRRRSARENLFAAIPSAGGVEEMREALDNFCRAAEYWAGCDEDCCADEAYSEILGSGGAWPAEAYARGRGALEGSPPRSARKHRQMSRVVTPRRGVGR